MREMSRPGDLVQPDESGSAVVRSWHDALNGGDLDRLMETMHDDVEFGGPRGTGHGAALVRDWAERAGIRLEPERWFQRGGDIVVAQQARWRDPETGELGEPIALASLFHLRAGLVQRVMRYDTLAEALAAANLDTSDESHSIP